MATSNPLGALWGALSGAQSTPTSMTATQLQAQLGQAQQQYAHQSYGSSIQITNAGTVATIPISNGTPITTYATAYPTETSIHLNAPDAKISFDGVELTKEDVELLHMIISQLRGKLIAKKASEKELTDAVNDAIKELSN